MKKISTFLSKYQQTFNLRSILLLYFIFIIVGTVNHLPQSDNWVISFVKSVFWPVDLVDSIFNF